MKSVYIYDPTLLWAIFPEYTVITEPVYLPPYCIYTGKGEVAGDETSYMLKKMISPSIDVSLPDRFSVVKFVHIRKGSKPATAGLEKYVNRLNPEQFLRELLYFMAVGKWKRVADLDVKVYELFAALTQSKREFLRMYFTLRDEHSFPELWSSVLTFLLRVAKFNPDDDNISSYYKGIIMKFKAQSDKLLSVIKLVYLQSVDELAILEFLLEVR